MTNPMIRIHNTETNEVIDREMTNAEHAVHKKQIAPEDSAKAAAKATAQAKLTALGLTVEDLQALGL